MEQEKRMEQPNLQAWPDLTEEAIRQSEALYQPLTEIIDLVTWLRDGALDKVLYVSPSYERIWGRSRESLMSDPQSFFESIHHADRERVKAAMAEHHAGGVDEEFRIVGPDGSLCWIHARTISLPGPNGGSPRVAGIAQDISKQKRIEEELKITLANLRERYVISRRIGAARTAEDVVAALRSLSTLAHASRASVLVFDKPGQEPAPPGFSLLVDWCHPDAAMGAEDPDDANLRLLTPLFSHERAVMISDIAKDERISEQTRSWLWRLETQSVLLFPLITSNEWYGMLVLHFRARLHLGSDEINYVEKVINQAAAAIYNFYLLEAETRARKEAEEANEVKLRFLAMISHELRTPLTSIKGFATTLLAEDVTWDTRSQRDFLETISQEADKLTDLIEHLLDLSRLEAGTLRIVPEKQTLPAIVDTAMAQLQALTQQHVLAIAVPGDLPALKVDPHRVAQVLTNLVSNAAKFSPPGTRITISASSSAGTSVQVNVTDEGPGIAAEKRARVFEPFYQEPGRENASQQAKGVGLGLAISKGLVEEHGGRIWVQDSGGPGTTISFTLPVAGLSNSNNR
jgi:two-component system, sensor histidine kinase and response regulator